MTLTETLLPGAGPDVPPISMGDWEVGRLVLAPAYRTDVEALRHCLRIALEYACAATNVDHLFATCTHVLSRLYRRFGFEVVGERKDYYRSPVENALVMTKRLAPPA